MSKASNRRTWLTLSAVALMVIVLWWLFGRGGVSPGPQFAVLKFATHPALDELQDSFVSELTALRPDIGITKFNANGDPASAKQLAELASRPGIDLIVSLATPASQAVAKTPSDIPFVYAAVADPEGSGVLSARSTGIKNAGKSIIEEAIGAIKEFQPGVRRIGTIYNPAEQNSVYVQGLLKQVCEAESIILEQRTTSDPNQLAATVNQLAGFVDVIYCTNDNTVNKGAKTLAEACIAEKIPFIIGELSTVEKGALFGVGVEYTAMGKRLAALAIDALNQRNSGVLPPPEGPPPADLWINDTVAARLHIEFTPEFRKRATRSVGP